LLQDSDHRVLLLRIPRSAFSRICHLGEENPMFKTSLIIAITLSLPAAGALAYDRTPSVSDRCAAQDLRASALIEDHGAVQTVPARTLYGATVVVQQARTACRNGHEGEALALYDLVLALDPTSDKTGSTRK
jgi:hypothetical protein